MKWTERPVSSRGATTSAEMDVVRAAFKKWKDVGVGLEFKEVPARNRRRFELASCGTTGPGPTSAGTSSIIQRTNAR